MRFQQMLGIWKEDARSYEGNRWKQQLRTVSQPAKWEVGTWENPGRLQAQSQQVMAEGRSKNTEVKWGILFPTQWIWVWANSGRRTGKPGMLQSMGSQRVRHNWVTEQQIPQTSLWAHRHFVLILFVCRTHIFQYPFVSAQFIINIDSYTTLSRGWGITAPTHCPTPLYTEGCKVRAILPPGRKQYVSALKRLNETSEASQGWRSGCRHHRTEPSWLCHFWFCPTKSFQSDILIRQRDQR